MRRLQTCVNPTPVELEKAKVIKAQLDGQPLSLNSVSPERQIYIELGNVCNLRCVHCYNNSGTTGQPPRLLTSELIASILGEARQLGFKGVVFSGGEPLLRHDLFDLIALAQGLGLLTKVITNGTLITPKVVQRLRHLNAHIDISLEGATPSSHDRIRGQGSFAGVLRGIECLLAAGCVGHLALSVVLNHFNQYDLPRIVELCHRYQVSRLQLIFPVRQGRALENWDDICLSRSDLSRLCREIFTMQQSLLGRVQIENEVVSTAVDALLFGGRATNYACSACRQLRVDYDGNVYPCAFFDHPTYQLGNVITAGSLQQAIHTAHTTVHEIDAAFISGRARTNR